MRSKAPIFLAKLAILAGALLIASCGHITVRDDADDELAVQMAPSSAVQTAVQAPSMSAVGQAKFE
jgi:hypothetical protein